MARKKVNVELNMTPFIGLFALLVVMLLLTAVWSRVAVLQTDTSASTAADDSTPPPPNRVTLNVTILPDRLEMAEDEKGTNVPHVRDPNSKEMLIDTMRMVQILNYWKDKYPDRTDVVLNTENSVSYKKLIKVFDTLIGNQFPDVGVNTQ